MRIRVLTVLLSALAVVGGCGDKPETVTSIDGLEGPPTYKRAVEDLPTRNGMTLTARSACDLRFRIEFTGEPSEVGKSIKVGRGESVRIWWEHSVLDETVDTEPPADMTAQGRTAVRVSIMRMGTENGANELRGRNAWVRPDHVKEVFMDLFVSSDDEVIEFGSDLELATIVVADVDATEVTLQPRERHHRVRLNPAKLGENERVHVMRLFVEIHPAGT